MTKPLSQAAVNVLCAAEDADVEPTTSLATISAAAIRAVLPHIQLPADLLDPSNAYGQGLLDRQRSIVLELDIIADELESNG